MSDWGWGSERTVGIWRKGSSWLRPLATAAPFITVLLLVVLFYLVGGAITTAKGILFDLPDGAGDDGASTSLVALVMPVRHDTMVFFDDSRYLLGDAISVRALGLHLAERNGRGGAKTLLILADRRVAGGELMELATVARRSGVARLLFATRRTEVAE